MSRKAKGQLSRNNGSLAGSVRSAPPSPPAVPSPRRWRSVAVCFFLAAAVWAVFGQTRHHEFVNFDDDVYVYENPAITHGVSWQGVVWAFSHRHESNWHPLTTLSHMLDCQLFGLNPPGHHLTNVLLHAATAILLFLLLRNLTGAFWRAAFVAAVFAIHPLRVESVAWVAERKDVLSGLCFMLALWAYSRYVQVQKRSPYSLLLPPSSFLSSPSYWLALLFFACGLMSKPMLVTLPFVLLLLDYWPLKRLSSSALLPRRSLPSIWRTLVLEKLPFLLLTTVTCGVTLWAQKHSIRSVQDFDIASRIGNALMAYATYIAQMFYPVRLAVFYPWPEKHLPVWRVVVSVVVLLMISAGVLAGRRQRPYLLMGWLWYLGMLVPVIGLLQVGIQAHADRYTYLPQIGIYVLLVWGTVELCGAWRYRRVVLGSAAVAVLAGLLAGAYVQTGYWKDSLSLWTHSLACTSENYTARNNLGIAQIARGNLAEAIQHCQRAIQLNPDNAMAHMNLGIALVRQGRLTEAMPHYKRAVQLDPDYAEAHSNLADALITQGRLAEAVQHCELALQLKADYADAHYNLGLALTRQGKLIEAIQQYQQALRLKPHHAEAHNNLANALATQDNLTEAVPLYQRALQLKPDYTEAHFNLGVALARQGKSTEANRQFQQALTLAMAQNNTALADTIRTRLQSYAPASSKPQIP